jgi:nucleoside phosphorylase
MTGICGGLTEQVCGGDLIVATTSLQYDVGICLKCCDA